MSAELTRTNLLYDLKRLAQIASEQNVSITTAESCTGGLLSSYLTKNPGASNYFLGSICAYHNHIKSTLLGVSPDMIKKEGAVSESVAIAMAKGALNQTASNVAISITGIAGPGGGSKQKPVGTICYAIVSTKACDTNTVFLSGSRDQIRYKIVEITVKQTINHIQRWF